MREQPRALPRESGDWIPPSANGQAAARTKLNAPACLVVAGEPPGRTLSPNSGCEKQSRLAQAKTPIVGHAEAAERYLLWLVDAVSLVVGLAHLRRSAPRRAAGTPEISAIPTHTARPSQTGPSPGLNWKKLQRRHTHRGRERHGHG